MLPEAHGAGYTFDVGGGWVDFQEASYGRLCWLLAVGGDSDRFGGGGGDSGSGRFTGWDVDHVDGRMAGGAEEVMEQKRVDRCYHEVGERHEE